MQRGSIWSRPGVLSFSLALVREPFDHPDFLFLLKHDGFRAVAHIWDGQCELVSRKRNSYKSFQALRDQLAQIKVQNAVIDGELVCLDDEGRSVFDALLRHRGHPTFYAFDLLYLNGRDLRQLPLIQRKRQLQRLIAGSGLPDMFAENTLRAAGWPWSTKFANAIWRAWSRNAKMGRTPPSAES